MSIGVIIAAIVVFIKPEWNIVDPICTYVFSIIVCCTSIPVFKSCVIVLMEGVPPAMDIDEMQKDILAIHSVEDIHDFHLWSISANKYSLSAHMTSKTPLKALAEVTDLLRRKYNIFHTTIQMEGTEED
jgi:zinc transporter 2